jgi:hypothetical protein
VKVAADSGQRKSFSAGQKMKKGLFLNGVDINGTGIPVHDAPEQTIDIDSDAALATLARRNHAAFRT